eukprot:gb/GFBE01030638.1/.p1 GENE.gb/GFBE01030638.1/~~gb/GFBE01030638.1/.p1  ORF type:complete len:318 (+),score=16.16 gb/GFBE01030638.1/:1-954(+)
MSRSASEGPPSLQLRSRPSDDDVGNLPLSQLETRGPLAGCAVAIYKKVQKPLRAFLGMDMKSYEPSTHDIIRQISRNKKIDLKTSREGCRTPKSALRQAVDDAGSEPSVTQSGLMRTVISRDLKNPGKFVNTAVINPVRIRPNTPMTLPALLEPEATESQAASSRSKRQPSKTSDSSRDGRDLMGSRPTSNARHARRASEVSNLSQQLSESDFVLTRQNLNSRHIPFTSEFDVRSQTPSEARPFTAASEASSSSRRPRPEALTLPQGNRAFTAPRAALRASPTSPISPWGPKRWNEQDEQIMKRCATAQGLMTRPPV